MNNIREVLSLPKNNGQKIIKISAKCPRKDEHRAIKKYDYGMCKNCKNIMHNCCKSEKYCVICIFQNNYKEMCPRPCKKITKHYPKRICYRCDKICESECKTCVERYVFMPIRHYKMAMDENSNIYCWKCWEEICK